MIIVRKHRPKCTAIVHLLPNSAVQIMSCSTKIDPWFIIRCRELNESGLSWTFLYQHLQNSILLGGVTESKEKKISTVSHCLWPPLLSLFWAFGSPELVAFSLRMRECTPLPAGQDPEHSPSLNCSKAQYCKKPLYKKTWMPNQNKQSFHFEEFSFCAEPSVATFAWELSLSFEWRDSMSYSTWYHWTSICLHLRMNDRCI